MRKRNYSNVDYSYSSLPSTRKEAFKDVYRHNFMTIFKSGVFLLLSFLPLIAFMIVMEINKMFLTLDNYSESDLFGVLFVWDLIVHIGFVILFTLVVLSLSGVFRIIKLLVFQEGIDFFYDFKKGIKENFKPFIISYFIYITIYLLTYLLQLFFLNQFVGIMTLILFHIVFTPAFIWGLFSINIYDTKLIKHIKNSYFFYVKTMGFSLLYVFMVDSPILISFIFYENIFGFGVNFIFIIIKNVLLMLALLFFYPFLLVVGSLYSNSKFDLFINKLHYPEIYQKGLYKSK